MKKLLYMAASLNGFIAMDNDDTGFISKEEWNSFVTTVKEAGNVIVGHRTYQILSSQPEFSEIEHVQVVIVAHKIFATKKPNHIVVNNPEEAINKLRDMPLVVIAGGSILNAAFLSAGLIDEIILDIEPIVFSKGIPLFQGEYPEKKLRLEGVKNLSVNEIQLRYSVIK